MQALILVGGEGTRLRPLTSTMPKPVVPLVGQPFIFYMLDWLGGHGVDDVVLSCGFKAEGVRRELGDEHRGIALRYVEEPEPLGTGGAVKFAEALLDERFLMLNGDILTDIDLSDQLAQHERTAAIATLALVAVENPSAYGLVRLEEGGSVREFVEKPRSEQIDTNLINAGAYVLERTVLEQMAPAGTSSSIERDVFPALVGAGLYGYDASGYWLDIGTPERYLQATTDILAGRLGTAIGAEVQRAGGAISTGARVAGSIDGPALVGPGSEIAAGAVIGPGTVIGTGVAVADGARLVRSVLLDGASVGAESVITGAILAPGARVGPRCRLEGDVVLGEDARVGAGNVLTAGARIFPGVELPEVETGP